MKWKIIVAIALMVSLIAGLRLTLDQWEDGQAGRAFAASAAPDRFIAAGGCIEPASEARELAATVVGRLTMTVGEGDHVSTGDLIAQVENDDLKAQLAAAGPKLERTADYGKLTIIAQPLFWLLKKVNQFIGNWGVDIIIVTLLIKLAFYKLTAASGRSMAKMRTLAPRIKSVQERYKDDREQLGRAMMELYKREKINPVAGCLPMLIQMPFFLGFYWVLLESAEMHQAPFIAWITDLSARDPYFVLPIIMGIANFAQFKMNPPPPDPTQAKVMAIMPIVMTVMMAWFPAGLVLYWITNTVTSALQQWRINQLVAADAKRAVT